MTEKNDTEQRVPDELPPDTDSTDSAEPERARKTGIIKLAALVAAGLILLTFAVLALNQLFAINDSLPTWDDLYYVFGLRTRAYSGHEDGTVSVHFIDVGQGDCALICTGEKNILIDCGEYDEYANVAQYLKGMGIERLDSVIMSHPHSDHMGCMYRVIRRFGASELVMPDVPEYLIPITGSYTRLEELVLKMKLPVLKPAAGAAIETDGIGVLTVVAPVKKYDDLNNSSCVLRYTFGEVGFLFCGDIESEAEADILAFGGDISADVIKVPHHGSDSSSTRLFVQSVAPRYAVFCVGEENDYGHPNDSVVRLYQNLGANVLRTDMNGDIVFVTDGDSIDVYTENAA
jgi:beta-lactamase superfamily II metal-dependent hydrolase